MVNVKQLRLPKFKEVKKVKKIRKLPQPNVSRFRTIKKFELLHRPFDLRFRGKINAWFDRLKEYKDFEVDQVLDGRNQRIVKLYFYAQPPDNRWLNQKEVLEKTKGASRKKLRVALVASLFQIWKNAR